MIEFVALLLENSEDSRARLILSALIHPRFYVGFRLEVPELLKRIIEYSQCYHTRSHGLRAKIAVKTNDRRILTPIGALWLVCRGARSSRRF